MKILVIDGQGGGLGKQLVAALSAQCPQAQLTAVGTNSLAASAMRKAFIASQGSLVVFTDSALKLVLLAIFLVLVLTPIVKAVLRKIKGTKANA